MTTFHTDPENPFGTTVKSHQRNHPPRFDLISCPAAQPSTDTMNRQKKIKQLLKAHAKKASAKLAPANKTRYISKADRVKLAAQASDDSVDTPEL